MPLHSIVMPSYNSAATIASSISSVLGQTVADYELIVVDDASTDSVFDVYSRFESNPRITIILSSLNQGPAVCRNIGLSKASGRFIHFLDSDDLMLPNLIESLTAGHEDSRSGLCCAPYLRVGCFRGKFFYSSVVTPPKFVDSDRIQISNCIPILSASIDRELLTLPSFRNSAGNEPISRPEDYLFWLDLYKLNAGLVSHMVSDLCAVYRVSGSSRSSNKFATLFRHYEIYADRNPGFPPASAFHILRWFFLAAQGKSLLEILDHVLP
jgi:teichuronic acid biosynthesis glycosyltransferase TuaG